MEKKEPEVSFIIDTFNTFLIQAKNGDQVSLQHLIDFLMPDITKFAIWTGMPKEDAIQAIICEFIDFILNNKI